MGIISCVCKEAWEVFNALCQSQALLTTAKLIRNTKMGF